MDYSDVNLFQLTRPRFALHLLIDLIYHPQPAGADRVTKAFQTAIGIDRQLTLQGEGPGIDILPGSAPGAEAQVFIGYKLGAAEAVMQYGDVDLIAGVFYPSLGLSYLGRGDILREIGEIEI